ncbi:DMT family transporter [Streptomyces sp. NBC_01803]|uniref:DMT family transporter n=1 Tax=Streptomyces sp. NBC_01803 TaxID=2975946 RepID=UPI002DD9D57B|nr:multidrug efflux SMR transporter [Streptomyces sp. NBC_01803]WSA46784.1 multidrug efflux SMR transporter [Streptomyces sp. NBC_01803]
MMYVTLAAAITAEIIGTLLMKQSDGFSRLWPSLGTIGCYLLAFTLLAQTLKAMEVGVAYAIWSGAGTAVVAAIGVLFLGEAASLPKVLGVVLVIGGVALLNLSGAH